MLGPTYTLRHNRHRYDRLAKTPRIIVALDQGVHAWTKYSEQRTDGTKVKQVAGTTLIFSLDGHESILEKRLTVVLHAESIPRRQVMSLQGLRT